MIFPARHGARLAAPSRGFTLIELITVMALLTTFLAFSAPRLSRFFQARGLTEEARRTLALTRYARSEAISRGVPMEVWFNVETGEYGVRPQIGFQFEQDKEPVEYQLTEGLTFDIDPGHIGPEGDVTILVWADGEIDEESPETVMIRDEEGDSLGIERRDYGLDFAIVRGDVEL